MNTAAQVGLSAVVIVFAIPGLLIEPGPVSEAAALSALMAIWGFGDEWGGE